QADLAQYNGRRIVRGVKPGTTVLEVSVDGARALAKISVDPARPHPFSFVNDIVPIFTKADCANSNCHGSVRGQKGFKLSLFGSDPDVHYCALTRNAAGRR